MLNASAAMNGRLNLFSNIKVDEGHKKIITHYDVVRL
jgi:hypothetical protein